MHYLFTLAATFAAAPTSAGETDVRTRINEAPVDLDTAWEELGFRMQLGLGYEKTRDMFGRSDWDAISIHVEPGVRLSSRWSVSLPVEYAVALGNSYSGIRWIAVGQLAWHPSTGSFVGIGAGYGGMLISGLDDWAVVDSDPTAPDDQPGLTEPELDRAVVRNDCAGDGWVAQVRLGQLWQVGELFATGPMATGQAHWTECEDGGQGGISGDFTEGPDWFNQVTLGLSWMFAWR